MCVSLREECGPLAESSRACAPEVLSLPVPGSPGSRLVFVQSDELPVPWQGNPRPFLNLTFTLISEDVVHVAYTW